MFIHPDRLTDLVNEYYNIYSHDAYQFTRQNLKYKCQYIPLVLMYFINE